MTAASATKKDTIAFIGIGLMGRPMAINLLNAGFNVNAWNRTRSKAESLGDFTGLTVYATVAEAIEGADFIVSMLETGVIVDEQLYASGAYQSAKPGALFIDMSSIPPDTAKAHAILAYEQGCGYLDAPVSGGTVGAQQATLAIMAGGKEEDFLKAQELFNALGKATYIGPAGTGQLAKLANQAIVGITIGAVSEALLLASAGGANPEAVREALMGGFANSRILELHGQRMIDRTFEPGGTCRVQLKDMNTIVGTAQSMNMRLPLSEAVQKGYLDAVASGFENLDHSALVLQLEKNNSPFTVK